MIFYTYTTYVRTLYIDAFRYLCQSDNYQNSGIQLQLLHVTLLKLQHYDNGTYSPVSDFFPLVPLLVDAFAKMIISKQWHI